jgi:ferritin-like metal-binding protein YciE
MPEKPNQRDAKLAQWLNEAHAKEAELEVALTAHIGLTEKRAYKDRLRRHLTETRDHKRRVAARINKLGGSPVAGPNLPGVPDAVGEVAGKAVAAVKTQVGTARAVVNDPIERQLRNAQEELREEHVEIALYSRIIAFAEEVGDRETAQLAKAIRRDEERMAKYLDAELVRLVKEVVRKQVPRDQRGTLRRSRRTTSSGRATSSRGTTTSRASAGSRRTKSSGSRRTSASSSRTTGRASGRSGGTRSSGRSATTRSGGGRSRSRARS